MSALFRSLTVIVILFIGSFTVDAQSKRTARPSATPTPITVPTPEPVPAAAPQEAKAKRNERPANPKTASVRTISSPVRANESRYVYEFARPGFTIGSIRIEHDDKGYGTITFGHKDQDELVTDPIRLTVATMAAINTAMDTLDFLNSTLSYQYEKDYSHLGNVKISLFKDGRSRTSQFNWTENTDAKVLADEYRKIANQYIWMFDINISRENQPLEAPKLFSVLDGYLRRKEISDPKQMVPFLTELSNDERMPLMARNHALRLIKQIERSK
jgi:hypothetical protein